MSIELQKAKIKIQECLRRQSNYLDLHDCGITDLSLLPELLECTHLEILYLYNNKITDLNPIKDLKNLERLGLRYNKIADLPSWITDFKMDISMEEFGDGICLFKNPLHSPPKWIVKQGKEAIKVYFKEKAQKGVKEVKLNEAKVLILSEGGVGKTSLRLKLENIDNPLPEPDDRTKGIDIYKYNFDFNNEHYTARIWDFGGQGIYYQVHRFFISQEALYILVTDSREKEGKSYEKWLQSVEIFTKSTENAIILFQNIKNTTNPAAINTSTFRQHYPSLVNTLYSIDLSKLKEEKTKKEFENLNSQIKICLERLVINRTTSFLSHWLQVREALEDKASEEVVPFIQYDEYKKICEEHKIEEKARKVILRYLNNLGIVFWYEDNDYTEDYVILNQEWITKAIYPIFDNKEIESKNGRLDKSDRETLWGNDTYKEHHHLLLGILKVFRLAYKRSNNKDYIVPSLMNDDKPQKALDWESEDTWKITYKYNRLMPMGLVNQLTADLCRYIPNDSKKKPILIMFGLMG